MVGPSMIGSVGGNNSDIGRCSFCIANFYLDDGWFLLFRDFSCSSIDFMNGGSLL